MKQHKRVFLDFAYAAVILVTAFALNLALLQWFRIPSVTPMIFVLGVFLIAWRTQGYFWGIVSSLASVMAVNYAFTYPYWAFNLIRPECLASAVVMLMVSIMTSTLTTRIKKQEQLRMESETEKMRANLLRAVSHDLRTPLTSIYGACSTVIDNYDSLGREQKIKLLSEACADAQWLNRMVENLLSVTRIDADGVAILNGDDALLDTVALPQRIVRCGESAHADVRVSALRDRGIDGIACTVTTERAEYQLNIPAPGRHMIYAASLAVAVGEELGLSVPEIERGVALYEPAGSRMRVHRLSGDRRLLDDCYNANPQSMSAALRVLAASEGKKIAVLGDMKELGELTESAHRAMGELCALLGIDRVIAVGEYARGIADAAHESAEWYPDAESAVDAARAAFTEGSVLLCKASHSMHLEKIVEELLKTT